MQKLTYCLLATIAAILVFPALADAEEKNYLLESSANRDARMQWWRDAKFGLFIHWGPYAVPAGTHRGQAVNGTAEWIQNSAKIPVAEYEEYARQFNPTEFDAKDWVKIATDAGIKYIVITSKHHDGFCLWDSKVTNYDLVDFTPFKRDVLRELSSACKQSGIKLCFYHSIMDWHHPDAQAIFAPDYNSGGGSKNNPKFSRYVEQYLRPQVKELVNQFDPAVMWFDGEWIQDWTEPQGKALYNELRNLKPSLIINNRVGKGRQGMMGLSKSASDAGDFGTPEQEVPAQGLPNTDWESCMTMNNTWGYNRNDHHWKPKKMLIHHLIDIVSKGGNFLLNVGPTAEGRIPTPSIKRLQAMGDWLKINGEAIYGVSASPYPTPNWGRYTKKPGKLYAHVFDWPTTGQLSIADEQLKISRAYLLAAPNQELKVSSSAGQMKIELPSKAPDPFSSVVVIEMTGAE